MSSIRDRHGRFFVLVVLAAGVVGGALLAAAPGASPVEAQGPELPDLVAACKTDNPYLITACYADVLENGPNHPAIVAFNDSRNDEPHFTLATVTQVGAIWGLAFSGQHNAVYAAAFHKRQMPFGPAGPGGVYRVDLATGDVDVFATVPDAGPDYHDVSAFKTTDVRAGKWAGKVSLGDLDVSPDGSELYVTNLNDRRIYRYALPDGAPLGSFDHGAAGESWSEDARPFALKSYGGRLFHGVVHSAADSGRHADLAGYVYSSAPDGRDMRRVAEFPLTYPRGTIAIMRIWTRLPRAFDHNILLNWQPWTDFVDIRNLAADTDPVVIFPMPIVADIEFDALGNMAVGVKDRMLDAGQTARDFDGHQPRVPDGGEGPVLPSGLEQRGPYPAVGAGDTLYGVLGDGIWEFDTVPEHYADGHKSMDETNLSGLAMIPSSDQLVSAAISMGDTKWTGLPWRVDRGAKWYYNESGLRRSLESICSAPVDTHV